MALSSANPFSSLSFDGAVFDPLEGLLGPEDWVSAGLFATFGPFEDRQFLVDISTTSFFDGLPFPSLEICFVNRLFTVLVSSKPSRSSEGLGLPFPFLPFFSASLEFFPDL